MTVVGSDQSEDKHPKGTSFHHHRDPVDVIQHTGVIRVPKPPIIVS